MGPPNVLQSTATDDTHHQPPPSNDASPSPSTPDAVVPAAYRLSVFDVEFAPEWKFKGSVAIDADITRPVTDFSIHAVGIDASSVQLVLPSADVISMLVSFMATTTEQSLT